MQTTDQASATGRRILRSS